MAQYGSDPDDGGSLAGSPANSSLTGDKLRRRPAHSRKASLESLDLENDTLLPAALERLHILPGASGTSGAGRPPRGRAAAREGASARESVASADESVARDGSSGESSRAAEVTSAEKPAPFRSSGDKIRAIVASGGALYDKPDGSRGYRGGDTRLVSIRRGATFDKLMTLLDDDDEESTDARLARRKKLRVYYRDPNDGVTLLRVSNDADIDEMFEEWDRRMATLARESRADVSAAAAAAAEKLKVYVSEISGSADSGAGTPRGATKSPAEDKQGDDTRVQNASRALDGNGVHKDTDREVSKSRKNASASASSGLQNVPSAELTLVHRLGGGAFGEVHLALWRGSEVAVKFLHARQSVTSRVERQRRAKVGGPLRNDETSDVGSTRDGDENNGAVSGAPEEYADSDNSEHEEDLLDDARELASLRESFLKEAKVMAALHHPNVVFVYGVVDDGDRLGIVEEFMRSGSLRRLLNLHVREAQSDSRAVLEEDTANESGGASKKTAPRGKRHLSPNVRARCAMDVARGMAYLHSRRFVHFDLKCDNVLTARQLGVAGGVTCKVADFGLSKQQRGTVVGVREDDGRVDRNREFTSGIASQRGTLPWTAPELFSDPSSATEKVDAYSFGVCMWELWTCDVPFKDMREQSVVWGIMTGKRPELPNEDDEKNDEPCVGWRDLMTALWREDPRLRPTFDEAVNVLEEALTKTNANNGVR